MRAVVFANGVITRPQSAHAFIQPDDLLIAADGGLHHIQALGLIPDVLIGDFDSLDEAELEQMRSNGVRIIQHPAEKDFTDLELALRYAQEQGAEETLVFAALGARWDQTLANLLLAGTPGLAASRIILVDGPQEIRLLRGGETLEIDGQPGDTASLIPLGGDARGVTTRNLLYPLDQETLVFGTTRGISNVLLVERASVRLQEGVLLCVVIHKNEEYNDETNDPPVDAPGASPGGLRRWLAGH